MQQARINAFFKPKPLGSDAADADAGSPVSPAGRPQRRSSQQQQQRHVIKTGVPVGAVMLQAEKQHAARAEQGGYLAAGSKLSKAYAALPATRKEELCSAALDAPSIASALESVAAERAAADDSKLSSPEPDVRDESTPSSSGEEDDVDYSSPSAPNEPAADAEKPASPVPAPRASGGGGARSSGGARSGGGGGGAGLSEYEKQRLANIASNQAMLARLGLLGDSKPKLSAAASAPPKPPRLPKVPRKRERPAEPSKRSSRLRGAEVELISLDTVCSSAGAAAAPNTHPPGLGRCVSGGAAGRARGQDRSDLAPRRAGPRLRARARRPRRARR